MSEIKMDDIRGNYKGNSHKDRDKEEKKKIDPVVKGKVKSKKKTSVRKFADVFIHEDVVNVKNYILMDVLLPAAKKAVSDIVTNGIDMMLYGETGRSSSRGSRGSRVSYSRYYDDRERDRDRGSRTRTRVGYDYDDIILENRSEAAEVLDRMEDLLDTYGIVSVADLYDLVGITGNYTDNKYGWTNLKNASVVRARDGYLLKMPKALPID